jgi:hypothetical protein
MRELMYTQLKLTFLFLVLFPSTAQAYIGPGLGLGTIGVVVGVLLSSVLVLISILWYPFKRLLKWARKTKDANTIYSNEDDL